MTTGDHTAVDNPGHARRQLVRGRRDHHLVQDCEPLADTGVPEQNAALRVKREREEIGIAETLRQLGGSGRGQRRRFGIAARLVLEHERQQQVAALDALLLLVLEQPLPAREPARPARDLAVQQ